MYLAIFRYDPAFSNNLEGVPQAIRNFNNENPEFEIVNTESFVTGREVTIHIWYKERKGEE